MSPEERNENERLYHRQWWIIAFAILGLIAIATPIQHFVTLGRAQHHGIAIGLFGLGFWAESIFSIKKLSKWAIRSYLAAGVFFVSVGIIFYKNTWLYSNVAVQTEYDKQLKDFLLVIYFITATIVTAIWIKWIYEEHKERKLEEKLKSEDEES